ncbi:hypothetical protein [Curtobacterium sp. JUb34]|uniref:hypothetical protein n=1 Tax=Curtobacterium sp. JUb34 TaxID=2485109 RepID=UPI00288BB7FF|nr:hypothetical protein [Curtobacterium sp. JUb34]
MAAARYVGQREERFIRRRSVLEPELLADAPVSQSVEHRSVVGIASRPPSLEDHLVDLSEFELVREPFNAAPSSAFGTCHRAVVAHDQDRDGVSQEVEPREPLAGEGFVPVQLPHAPRRRCPDVGTRRFASRRRDDHRCHHVHGVIASAARLRFIDVRPHRSSILRISPYHDGTVAHRRATGQVERDERNLPMDTMVFINLPVTDLDRSKAFYEALG